MTATQAPTPGPLTAEDWASLADLHTLKGWLHGVSLTPDWNDVVADGGVTVAMVVQQEAGQMASRVGRVIDNFRLAPTAPVEASGSEREAVAQALGSQRGHPDPWPTDFYDADAALKALTALRPQPSGETREVSGHDAHTFLIEFANAITGATLEQRIDHLQAFSARLNALLSARPLALGGQHSCGEGKRVRHKKRGTEYTIIGVGRAQGELSDEDPVVLYRGDADGGLWVRHQAEFSDGRFEYITTPARAEAQDEGAAGEAVEDKPWPDTPLANALHDHFVWTYGLNQEEASESAGDILDIIDKHTAPPSPTPAADADRVLQDLADRVTAEVKRGADGSPVQALGALSNIEGLVLAALQQETQP